MISICLFICWTSRDDISHRISYRKFRCWVEKWCCRAQQFKPTNGVHKHGERIDKCVCSIWNRMHSWSIWLKLCANDHRPAVHSHTKWSLDGVLCILNRRLPECVCVFVCMRVFDVETKLCWESNGSHKYRFWDELIFNLSRIHQNRCACKKW